MDHHHTIGIAVDFGGVGRFGPEGLWGHVAGGARCLCQLGRGEVEDLSHSKISDFASHAGC